jgi:hypothetical protein
VACSVSPARNVSSVMFIPTKNLCMYSTSMSKLGICNKRVLNVTTCDLCWFLNVTTCDLCWFLHVTICDVCWFLNVTTCDLCCQTSPESPGIYLLLQRVFRGQSLEALKNISTSHGVTEDEYQVSALVIALVWCLSFDTSKQKTKSVLLFIQ